MSEQPERPATVGRRKPPRPASDEFLDPVDLRPRSKEAVSTPAQQGQDAPGKKSTRLITVQLGARVEVSIADAFVMQAKREDTTQRKVLEGALQFYMAHSQVASRLKAEADRREVEPVQIIEEALQGYLK